MHNVPTDRILPPTILLTADRKSFSPPKLYVGVYFYRVDDDRVVPLHSFKHAATLQHTLPHNPNPLLIRIDKKAGHGAGKSTVSLEARDGEGERLIVTCAGATRAGAGG